MKPNSSLRTHLIFMMILMVALTLLSLVSLVYPNFAEADSAQLTLDGIYVGTVAITSPVQLSVLDLAFTLDDSDGIRGQVDVTRTLVFSGSPTLAGEITGSIDGITPTVRIASESFGGVMAGAEVQRQFVLDGLVLENGDLLQGVYSETITGLLPDPFTVQGLFLVSRPSTQVSLPSLALAVPDTVGVNSAVDVSATLLDGTRQPITGQSVTFAVTSGSLNSSTATTNDNGVATVTFTAGNTPTDVTIHATVDNDSLQAEVSASLEVIVVPTIDIEASQSTIPTTDGNSTIVAMLTDSNGSPLADLDVNFNTTLGSLSSNLSTTDSNGRAETTLAAEDLPGLANVTIHYRNEYSATVAVHIETPRVAEVSLEADADQIKVGESISLSIQVKDQFERGLAGQSLSLSAALGTVSPDNPTTDAQGVAKTVFTAGDAIGSGRVTVLAGSLNASWMVVINSDADFKVFIPIVIR